jgi:pSer/pThr/pTyr-binding forkhead associated (FHA) protein
MIIKERVPPTFAWLVVVNGPDRATIGKVHTLRPDMTTVGRGQDNHIVLVDETCSTQHFRIRCEAQEGEPSRPEAEDTHESAFVLYDMGSRNGTFVGDKKTYKDPESQTYRHKLQDGDYLLVGETTLVFKRI